MRWLMAALVLAASVSATVLAGDAAPPALDCACWRSLPVLDGGRYKPLDSLAWETFRMLSNKTSFVDPESQRKLDATAMYLVLLLEWQGWEQPAAGQPAFGATAYYARHKPDRWDKMPLLIVDSPEVCRALGLPEGQRDIAPLDLGHAKILDPQTGAEVAFVPWAEKLQRNRQEEELLPLERDALGLAHRLWTYQQLRMGQRLAVLPIPDDPQQAWATIAEIMAVVPPRGQALPAGMSAIKEAFQQVRAAYRDGSAEGFRGQRGAVAAAEQAGPSLGIYPARQVIEMEVSYNRWAPFRIAWILTLLATVCVLLGMGTRSGVLYAVSLAAFTGGLAAIAAGFAMRTVITGRPLVTNMYESVIYVGLGAALIGLIFELIYRQRFVLAAAGVVATLALIVADSCPIVLDPSLQPLRAVLRDNFWLVVHVLSITLSYAALALCMGIADITLGYYLFRSRNREAVAALSRFTYRVMQVGVLLLAVGTITGAIWASYAWGRFWGWDPKEVWALIALLGYLAVLHARRAGLVDNFWLAALSAVGFSLVIMAWYGVNFVLGTGLHAYGFGGGGKWYVAGGVLLQLAYTFFAALARDEGLLAPDPEKLSPTA